jgi:hypothetical protein
MFWKSSKEYENGNGNACYPVCKDGLQRPVIAKNNQKAFPKRPPTVAVTRPKSQRQS